MANVAGVSQLIENVVPATSSASPSPAPEHSFANVLQQAKSDAGVPIAPVKTQAEQSGKDRLAAGQKEQSSGQAVGASTPDAPPTSQAPQAIAAPQPSTRYNATHLLSAIFGGANTSAVLKSGLLTRGSFAQTPPSAAVLAPAIPAGVSSPLAGLVPTVAANPSAASTQANITAQGAALDNKVEASLAATVLAATGAEASGKAAPLIGAVPPSATTRSSIKHESASRTAEPAVLPVSTAVVTNAQDALYTPPASLPIADTLSSSTAPAIALSPILSVAGSTPTTKPFSTGTATANKDPATLFLADARPASLAAQTAVQPTVQQSFHEVPAPAAFTVDQPNSALFRQSVTGKSGIPLAVQAATLSSRSNLGVHPLAVPGDNLAAASTTPNPVAATALAQAPPSPLSSAKSTAKVVALPAQSLTAVASPVLTKASAPPLQPVVASALASADGKANSHLSAPAASLPAATPVLTIDDAASITTTFPVAHTPVAVTSLSNANGPALTALSPSLAAPSTASAANTDALQHTTLTSTPTTLEVGVANGTHGWLKVRAELNASGTVDASLTGANAAATGRLHNDLPALSSFLQNEKVVLGSLNVTTTNSATNAAASALHAVGSTLEPVSSFTRSAAEAVGATGTAVAADAGTAGGRAPQQQAQQQQAQQSGTPALDIVPVNEPADNRASALTTPALYNEQYGAHNDLGGSDALSQESYGGGGSWLNVRV